MDTLKLGLIGAWGLRGKLAKYAEEQFDNVTVTGAADIHDASLQAFREFYGNDGKLGNDDEHGRELFVTNDYHKLLSRDDIDAVFIVTPDYCHEEHAVAALKAGKPVYLEKPLAITTAGCDRILRTAYTTKTKLYVGHNMRYFPAVLKMKELIASGIIGEVRAVWCRHFVSIGGDAYFKDWHSERRNTTGLLIQKGAHDIDVIHWLTDSYTTAAVGMGNLTVYNRLTERTTREESTDIQYDREQSSYTQSGREHPAEHGADAADWANCRPAVRLPNPAVTIDEKNWPPLEQKGVSPIIDVEDHSMVLMQLENNIQASYMQCHYTPDYHRNYTIIGTEGRIENIGDSGNCSIYLYNTRKDGFKEPDKIYTLEEAEGSHGGSDPAVVRGFIEFVMEGKLPNTSPVAARQAVAVGEMATESLRADNALRTIPPLDKEIADYFLRGQKDE